MNASRSAGGRVRSLRRLMQERGIDVLLVTGRENIRYLTGFTGSAGCVIVAGSRPLLITDFRYRTQARVEAPQAKLVIQHTDIVSALGKAAAGMGVGTLWFDEASLTFDRIRGLRKQGLRLRGIKDPVAELRQRKDAGEIMKLRTAIRSRVYPNFCSGSACSGRIQLAMLSLPTGLAAKLGQPTNRSSHNVT